MKKIENTRYNDEGNNKHFKISKTDDNYTKISFEKAEKKYRRLLIDTDTFGDDPECKENVGVNS